VIKIRSDVGDVLFDVVFQLGSVGTVHSVDYPALEGNYDLGFAG
jgi:hypothetical protein